MPFIIKLMILSLVCFVLRVLRVNEIIMWHLWQIISLKQYFILWLLICLSRCSCLTFTSAYKHHMSTCSSYIRKRMSITCLMVGFGQLIASTGINAEYTRITYTLVVFFCGYWTAHLLELVDDCCLCRPTHMWHVCVCLCVCVNREMCIAAVVVAAAASAISLHLS